MHDKIVRNGIDVFDPNIGGIIIDTPIFPSMKIVPSYNYYDALRERSSYDPIAFNKFLSQASVNAGFWG